MLSSLRLSSHVSANFEKLDFMIKEAFNAAITLFAEGAGRAALDATLARAISVI